jgi:hypothetical protein
MARLNLINSLGAGFSKFCYAGYLGKADLTSRMVRKTGVFWLADGVNDSSEQNGIGALIV